MNVYEKLLQARILLKKQGIKQGGKNDFAKYTYYELADFVPAITDICAEVKIIPMVSFGEQAIMTIVDLEKPEDTIIFSSPMSTASLKGCHEVQNLGAVQTYLRRYLYQTAFEIIESDFVENSTKNPAQEPNKFDRAKELAEFEVRVNNSDWDNEKKRLTILGLPKYSDKILKDLDAKLAKAGF